MASESASAPRDRVDPFIAAVVAQHAEEAASLYTMRTAMLRAPDIRLQHLRRDCDDRLAAHLDGLSVAGRQAWSFCQAALDNFSGGAVFTAAVRAIEERNQANLDSLIALAEASADARTGLLGAFGWLEPVQLQGIVKQLLSSDSPFRFAIGMAACAMHRVNPGLDSGRALQGQDADLRTLALRTAGELGVRELMPTCAAAAGEENPACQFWGAWSAVLLGDRDRALLALADVAITGSARGGRAFRLALEAMSVASAHTFLKTFAGNSQHRRRLIEGSGIVGDPTYVPWLLQHMREEAVARLAGEAFSLITGADLDALQLDRPQPQEFDLVPNDDPDDPNVDIDPDEGLMWPDQQKVQQWWNANSRCFQPGARYFMGAPVTRNHCIDVLKNGYQRQRTLAAHYLCLLEPGTPLFNTSAPAWRQQKLLAQM